MLKVVKQMRTVYSNRPTCQKENDLCEMSFKKNVFVQITIFSFFGESFLL